MPFRQHFLKVTGDLLNAILNKKKQNLESHHIKKNVFKKKGRKKNCNSRHHSVAANTNDRHYCVVLQLQNSNNKSYR